MKKTKLSALILSIVLICVMLSGCLADVCEVMINPDGSGSCVIYEGFEEKEYEEIQKQMQEAGAEPDEDEIGESFDYNGKTYIGSVKKFDFADISELKDTLNLYFGNIYFGNEEQDPAIFGTDFVVSEDTLTCTISIKEEAADVILMESDGGVFDIDEEEKKKLEEAVVILDITFPSEIKKISGMDTEFVTADENNVVIDLIGLSKELDGKEEVFTFECSFDAPAEEQKESVSFADVTEDDWYYEQVMEMVELGLFEGKGDNLFCPDDTMTKAEFITVVARMCCSKPVLNLTECDADIWWDRYYKACIDWSIISEEDFVRESMDNGMSRQEMALVAVNLAEQQEGFEFPETFKTEEDIPDYEDINERFLDYVISCYSYGILCGADEEGSFKPNDTLTRAEASTVLYRILEPSARVFE